MLGSLTGQGAAKADRASGEAEGAMIVGTVGGP
jgi:hypothetical protein